MTKKNKEYIIIASILIILIGAYFIVNKVVSNNLNDSQTVEVREKDTVLMTFDISKDANYVIDVGLGHMHIEVLNGKYRVHDVDCPDKICEKVGWVSSGSPTLIVCLPNNIVLVQV